MIKSFTFYIFLNLHFIFFIIKTCLNFYLTGLATERKKSHNIIFLIVMLPF